MTRRNPHVEGPDGVLDSSGNRIDPSQDIGPEIRLYNDGKRNRASELFTGQSDGTSHDVIIKNPSGSGIVVDGIWKVSATGSVIETVSTDVEVDVEGTQMQTLNLNQETITPSQAIVEYDGDYTINGNTEGGTVLGSRGRRGGGASGSPPIGGVSLSPDSFKLAEGDAIQINIEADSTSDVNWSILVVWYEE